MIDLTLAEELGIINARGLTLYQPWGTAIADEIKRFETRSWSTSYRGPLLIHAGAKSDSYLAGALWTAGHLLTDPVDMPSKAVVAVADLTEIYRTNSMDLVDLTLIERRLGDFGGGRFAWKLENIRKLATPVKCNGAMGLWKPTPETLQAVAEQVGRI